MNKLLSQITKQFSGLNKALSLVIDLSQEELKLEGGEFSFNNNEINFENSFDKLSNDTLQKSPLILTVEGKGVLHKFIELKPDKIKIRNIIPNLKEEEFYINLTPNSKGTWVSLIRKDLIERILNQLNIPLENVIDLHMGPITVQWLSEVVEQLPTVLGQSLLNLSDKDLIEVTRPDTITNYPTKILGNNLEYKFHLPIISALVSFSGLNSSYKKPTWLENTNNQKSKKIFQSTLVLMLGLLLLVFMGNLIIKQILAGKLNEKLAESHKYNNLNNKARLLQKKVDLKEGFIHELSLETNPQFAYFSDEIGQSVPKKIQLSSININPLKKAIRKNKLIEFKSGQIVISGFCKTSQICNEWVTNLRELRWPSHIELKEFKFNTDNIGEFKINVFY